jgi:hypothetical protein
MKGVLGPNGTRFARCHNRSGANIASVAAVRTLAAAISRSAPIAAEMTATAGTPAVAMTAATALKLIKKLLGSFYPCS